VRVNASGHRSWRDSGPARADGGAAFESLVIERGGWGKEEKSSEEERDGWRGRPEMERMRNREKRELDKGWSDLLSKQRW
jgi:hypothetical protein